MAKYRCPAIGECAAARSQKIFDFPLGIKPKCPDCNINYLESAELPSSSGSTSGSKTPLIAAVGATVLVAMVGGGYYFTNMRGKAPEAPPPAPVPVVEQAPAPVVAPPATPGIAPPESETKALRQEGQNKLTAGDAASAEKVGSKAAANEMLKLAIAKMTQGKLDDAEKDLLEARARDPKQPLVAYNMAVLRLKQGRRDDALKEFEASFMAGFSYFDKMDQDPDLVDLRKDARFTDLVAQYRNKPVK